MYLVWQKMRYFGRIQRRRQNTRRQHFFAEVVQKYLGIVRSPMMLINFSPYWSKLREDKPERNDHKFIKAQRARFLIWY